MRRVALVATAGAAVLVGAAGPAGAAECPTQTFLAFEHVVYAAEPVPASVSLAPGAVLGEGTLDRPTGSDACQREQEDVRVVLAGGLDPGVAVAVEGRPGSVFVLGGRCSGYEGDERWTCILQPLRFQGVGYAGVRAPADAPELPLGEALGDAELGGQGVAAVRIEGVDPAVAVAVEGRPREAFLAPDACPYERFGAETLSDDLRRCLAGPGWLVFDPPGARVGVEVVAYLDRALRPELEGAAVELVQLNALGDVVPRDRSGAVRIGTLSGATTHVAGPMAAVGARVVPAAPQSTHFARRTGPLNQRRLCAACG